MQSLDDIALRTGTDKASFCHDYCQKYERYLHLDRLAELRVLEIGVQEGASVAAWREFFENSTIVGIDINPKCSRFHAPENRVHIEIGSQYDENFLRSVAAKYGPFDLIIDDGSHLQKHVIYTFGVLWPTVRPGGVYVVEDSVTSYWEEYDGGLKEPSSMIEYFKGVIDEVNFFGEKQRMRQPTQARHDDTLIQQFQGRACLGTTMESIQFLNSIILMRKRF